MKCKWRSCSVSHRHGCYYPHPTPTPTSWKWARLHVRFLTRWHKYLAGQTHIYSLYQPFFWVYPTILVASRLPLPRPHVSPTLHRAIEPSVMAGRSLGLGGDHPGSSWRRLWIRLMGSKQLVGGFNHLEKIWKSMGRVIPYKPNILCKKKSCLKPPTKWLRHHLQWDTLI